MAETESNVVSLFAPKPALWLCTKTGPCPCEDPCRWAEQAMQDIRRYGWPEAPTAKVYVFPPPKARKLAFVNRINEIADAWGGEAC
jgi:hypothetical protein